MCVSTYKILYEKMPQQHNKEWMSSVETFSFPGDCCHEKMKNWCCQENRSKRYQRSDFNINYLIFNIDLIWPSSQKKSLCRIWFFWHLIYRISFLSNLLISEYNGFYILTSANFNSYLSIQALAITNFFNFFIYTMLMVLSLPRNSYQHSTLG